MLEQYHRSARKRVMAAPKFYFFDSGAARALAQTIFFPVAPGTSYYGGCFEQFVVAEIFRLVSYANRGWRLFTLTTREGFEIDLIIERPGEPPIVCEIKSAEIVEGRHLKGLRNAKKDFSKVPASPSCRGIRSSGSKTASGASIGVASLIQ